MLELDSLFLVSTTAVGHVLSLSRRYDHAIEAYRKALRPNPNFAQAHLCFVRPHPEKGRYDEAIREVRTTVRLTQERTMSLAVLVHAFASADRSREAKEIRTRPTARRRRRYVPPYWIALIHMGLKTTTGPSNGSRAARERSAWLVWIKVETRFDRLRPDARCSRLLLRARLT